MSLGGTGPVAEDATMNAVVGSDPSTFVAGTTPRNPDTGAKQKLASHLVARET